MTIPSQTIEIRERPASIKETLASLDNRFFHAIVAVPVHAWDAGQTSKAALRRYLAKLVTDAMPAELIYKMVAWDTVTQQVYVTVSLRPRDEGGV